MPRDLRDEDDEFEAYFDTYPDDYPNSYSGSGTRQRYPSSRAEPV